MTWRDRAGGFRRRLGAWLKPPRRLRFTREGKWFVVLVLAVGIAAVNTGINLLYLILATLLSLIITSGLLSEMSLRRVHLSLSWPSYVYTGQEFLIHATLVNHKRFLPSFSLSLSLFGLPEPGWKLERSYTLKISAGEKRVLRCCGLTEERGLYSFGRFRLATGFPFGLFEKSVVLSSSGTFLSYPRMGRITPEALRQLKGMSRETMETLPARMTGEEEFHALRDYQPGDNPRRIHWRTSARLGHLLVKEFEGTSSNKVVLLMDTWVPAGQEDSRMGRLEQAIRFVATLARDMVEQGFPLTWVAYSPQLQWVPVQGRNLHPLYRILALLQPTADKSLDDLWGEVFPRIPRNAFILFVSLGPEGTRKLWRCGEGLEGRKILDISQPDFGALFGEG